MSKYENKALEIMRIKSNYDIALLQNRYSKTRTKRHDTR